VVFAESAELQLDWLKPDDGPGWERRDWNADSIPEYSLRWGLEAIRAPLAWGCETGAQNVPIGVIDHGFHPESIPDIQANLVRLHNPLLVLQGGHGDLVSAIVGARGNDGARMTGVMWAAGLHLLENSAGPGGKTFVDDNDLLVSLGIGNQILAAANAGARVINISSGANWTQVEDAQIRLGHPTPDMNRRLQEYGTDIRRALRSLGANNIKPLWSFPPAMMDTTRNGTDTHRSSASFRRR
jgi:subtilisin family serine protease